MRIREFSGACLIMAMMACVCPAQDQTITIHAGTLLDGKGGAQRNITVVVQGSKIQKIGTASAAAQYDLRKLTVLPGMIDTHVHIAWHFGPDGRFASQRGESPTQAMGYAIENA